MAFRDVKRPSGIGVMADDSKCSVDSDVRFVKDVGIDPANSN
jgi:hypothetical protein